MGAGRSRHPLIRNVTPITFHRYRTVQKLLGSLGKALSTEERVARLSLTLDEPEIGGVLDDRDQQIVALWTEIKTALVERLP